VELWDDATTGLCLRVSAGSDGTQAKAWFWRYRALDGRQPRLKLADYSETHGLKWARLEVEELRVRVRKGDDPANVKRTERAKAKAEPLKTFNDLADAFLIASERGHWKPRRKQKRASTIEGERGVLRRHIRPVIGALRLEDIDRRMIRQLLRGMIDQGIGAQTNKAHAVIRQVLAFGIAEDRLTTNPAVGVEKPAAETPRTRVLTDAELKTLWTELAKPSVKMRLPAKEGEKEGRAFYVGASMRIILQLCALLLVRRTEVAGMRLAELNLAERVWIIPGSRMKGGMPHLVPLPPVAVKLIEKALRLASEGRDGPPPCVFASPSNPDKPIRHDSVTHAMVGMCTILGFPSASPHDLRRTGSTILTSERLGVTPFIRSLVLGHTTDAGGGAAVSSKHYDANTYVAEKRRALEAWEGLLMEIVGEQDRSANVLSFSGSGNEK
jgi:integrase